MNFFSRFHPGWKAFLILRMNGIGSNLIHQGGIDGLLLLHPTHLRQIIPLRQSPQNGYVITFGINFIQRQSGPQDTLNLAWLHLFLSRKVGWVAVKKGADTIHGDQPL